MLTHTVFGRGEFLAYGQEFHGPLIALGVSLLLALAGRFLKAGFIAAASGGLGVVAGWYTLSTLPFSLAPRLLSDRLTVLAAAGLVVALTAARFALNRGPWPPLLLMALGSGWWLAGGPHSHAELLAVWPVAAGIAAAVIAVGWFTAGPVADPLVPALAGATLAGSLDVAGSSWSWTIMALVPAAAALGMLAAPRMPALVLLPLAADIAATGAATDLTTGHLARGELRAVDVAVLSPLLALWLTPRLAGWLRLAGRAGPLLAAVLAGAVAVGVAWGSLRLRGR
jgi:hypothetical protein